MLLSIDSDKEIQISSIEILPIIIKSIGTEEIIKLIGKSILLLYNNQNEEILKCLLDNTKEILFSLFESKDDGDSEFAQNIFEDILKVLTDLSEIFERNKKWRLFYSLLNIFQDETILECFSIHNLNEKYVPFLINSMKNDAYSVRILGCKNLANFMKMNYVSKKKTEILKILYDNFMKSKNFQRRLIYIEFCILTASFLTFNFIKLYILPDIMELSNDKVANIRFKICYILSDLRNCLGNNDQDLLNKFNNVLQKLSEDKDSDVSDVF